MKQKMRIFCLISILCVSICGCGKKHPQSPPGSGLATRVDIHRITENGTVSRFYNQSAKVEAVLIYLRLLEPMGPVQLPENAVITDYYEIVVYLADGSRRIHRQCSDCYATTEQGWWGVIDPRYGQQLSLLMHHVPSDPELAEPAKTASFSAR